MRNPSSTQHQAMHILVVDDNPQILLLMKEFLKQDFDVATFEDGQEAIEHLGYLSTFDTPVVAAFIDLTMPNMPGPDVALGLRRLDPRINIILMTGNVDFSSENLDEDLQDHILLIQKPFAAEEIRLQARFFRRTWLNDVMLSEQRKALYQENKAKEALAKRSQAVLDTALDCIITIDHGGRVIQWNPVAERTFGYSKEEILGRQLSETIIPHSLRESHEAGMSKYNATGEGPILGQRLEVPAKHKDGRDLMVELTVTPIVHGETHIFTAYLRDITAKLASAAQLQLQSKALEAAANGIVITDPRGIIVWSNAAFSEMTGYTARECRGNNMSILKSGDHDAGFYREMWDTILDGQVWAGEIRNKRKTGEVYTEEMTITPVLNDQSEITYFIAIKQDVTLLQQIDARLDRSEQNQRIINYFATSLLGSNTVEEILWDIAHNCISQLGLEDALIYLTSEDGSCLQQKAAFGANKAMEQQVLNPIEIPVGQGIVGSVAKHGKTELIPDLSLDSRYIVDDEARASELAVPILYENKVIGVIDSEHSQKHFFQEHHVQILEAIASLASNKLMRAMSLVQTEKSEKKYRSIFESIQDVYAEVDYDSGIISEISPSIERASGYTREEMLGQPMANFFSPHGVPAELMEELLRRGEVNDYTVDMVNKEGIARTVSFSVNLLKDDQGQPEKIVGTMRDITERRRAMQQIQESEERLKLILNILPTGILIADPVTCKIEQVNPAASRILNIEEEKLRSKKSKDVLNVDDRDTLFSQEFEKLDASDMMLTRADGSEIPILVSRLPLMIREKKFALFSFVDNSTQKEAEEALKTNIEMKTNFVSNLSHELRTPMTSIYGFAGTILRDQDMPDEVRKDFIRIIFEESQRLTRLIENVLDLSRMEAGRMNYNMQPLELASIIDEALNTQQVLIRDKRMKIELEIMADPPLISADHDSMNQLVINLISNAIKFSEPDRTIKVGLRQQSRQLEFMVQDTGVGIPQSDLPHIFEKFYRVQRKGREDQGTGIGLSIVKEIVDRHEGHIQVESEEGKGTQFRVSFPILE